MPFPDMSLMLCEDTFMEPNTGTKGQIPTPYVVVAGKARNPLAHMCSFAVAMRQVPASP